MLFNYANYKMFNLKKLKKYYLKIFLSKFLLNFKFKINDILKYCKNIFL